jgi:hypothetical protein
VLGDVGGGALGKLRSGTSNFHLPASGLSLKLNLSLTFFQATSFTPIGFKPSGNQGLLGAANLLAEAGGRV